MENESQNIDLQNPNTLPSQARQSIMKIDLHAFQMPQKENDNKKSSFGRAEEKNQNLENIHIDIQNPKVQQILVDILKKDVKKQKEVQFIDKAIGQLKFLDEKKKQLSSKLYFQLLEKLKYEFIQKEKTLFELKDKGDKFYIVLKGELILLLPPKPFEVVKQIDHSQIQKLKEKYFRLKDFEMNPPSSRDSENQLRYQKSIEFKKDRENLSQFPIDFDSVTKLLNSDQRSHQQHINSTRLNSAFRKRIIADTDPFSSAVSSPKSIMTPSQRQNINSSFKQYDSEEEINTIDLYCQAFYPQLNKSTIFYQGEGFGEIAILRKTERSGTVVSKEDSHLITLDKQSFDEVLGQMERQISDEKIEFLKSYSFFKEVNEKYLLGFIHCMKIKYLVRGDIICNENDIPMFIYFVWQGEVELSKKYIKEKNNKSQESCLIKEYSSNKQINSSTRVRMSVLEKGSSIGEDEVLLDQEQIGFQAQILSPNAEIWVMEKKIFSGLLKQQRTFTYFYNQSQEKKQMRKEKLENILKSIKREESYLKVSRCNPSKDYVTTKKNHSKFSIEKLINKVEGEVLEEKQNCDKKANRNNMLTKKSALYFNDSKDCGNYDLKQTGSKGKSCTVESNTLSQMIPKELESKQEKEQKKTDNQIEIKQLKGKILNMFSRTNEAEKISKSSKKKKLIFKEISKNYFTSQRTEYLLKEQKEQKSATLSDRPRPHLPFQKNLIFQPNLGDGIKKEHYKDPFNPTYFEIKASKNSSSSLNVKDYQQQEQQTNQIQIPSNHPNYTPRSNFEVSIQNIFDSILNSKRNSANFIDYKKRDQNMFNTHRKSDNDTQFSSLFKSQQNQDSENVDSKHSKIPVGYGIPLCKSLPSLDLITPFQKKSNLEVMQQQQLSSVQGYENNQNDVMKVSDTQISIDQKLSERDRQLSALQKNSNSVFLSTFATQLKEQKVGGVSTLNFSVSSGIFDTFKVLSQESDFSKEEQKEIIQIKDCPKTPQAFFKNNKFIKRDNLNSTASSHFLKNKSPSNNIHMENRRLLNLTKNNTPFYKSEKKITQQENNTSQLINQSQKPQQPQQQQKQLTLTENSFLESGRKISLKSFIGSLFKPLSPSLQHGYLSNRSKDSIQK